MSFRVFPLSPRGCVGPALCGHLSPPSSNSNGVVSLCSNSNLSVHLSPRQFSCVSDPAQCGHLSPPSSNSIFVRPLTHLRVPHQFSRVPTCMPVHFVDIASCSDSNSQVTFVDVDGPGCTNFDNSDHDIIDLTSDHIAEIPHNSALRRPRNQIRETGNVGLNLIPEIITFDSRLADSAGGRTPSQLPEEV